MSAMRLFATDLNLKCIEVYNNIIIYSCECMYYLRVNYFWEMKLCVTKKKNCWQLIKFFDYTYTVHIKNTSINSYREKLCSDIKEH